MTAAERLMNTVQVAESASTLRAAVVDFVSKASVEIAAHDEQHLPALAAHLRGGTPVYVSFTPNAAVEDVVKVAVKVQRLGFKAVPHIVARRMASLRQLKDALTELRENDVDRILLIAGDTAKPAGRFESTLDLIDSGAIVDCDIASVGVAGHPEGHRQVGPAVLWDALERKQQFARDTGIRVHIVTQFGFDPEAIGRWSGMLGDRGITLPVHVGIAGPTALPRLIKYAMRCGIGASLNALMKNLSPLANLAAASVSKLATTPDQMVLGVLRERERYAGSRIERPHFFTLGGAVEAARWVAAVADSLFELDEDGSGFTLAPGVK